MKNLAPDGVNFGVGDEHGYEYQIPAGDNELAVSIQILLPIGHPIRGVF